MTSVAPATNVTASGLYHGWMPTPNERGTTDILWSCLATIFLCVWTALHPPVPYYRRDKPKFSQDWRKWLRQKIVESKLVPALICVVAPEYMVIWAVSNFMTARDSRNKLNLASHVQISAVHGFLVEMGGFCLRSPSGRYHQLSYKEFCVSGAANELKAISDPNKVNAKGATPVTSNTQRWIHKSEIVEERGHLGAVNASEANSDPDDADVTGEILAASHTEEWIHELEKFNEEDINALSEADSLTKMIACFQALWFATQIISRLVERRAVTLLEVSTCAYVLSASIAYAAWWEKPQNCSMPLMIDCSDDTIARLPITDYEKIEGTWKEYIWIDQSWDVPDSGDSIMMSMVFTFPVLFGAIHIAAWNTTLPSQPELWMWRSSSVICSSISLVFAVTWLMIDYFFSERAEHLNPERAGHLFDLLFKFTIMTYVIVRLYMIFEVFFSMRALPYSAYETVSWSAYIPHI